MARVALIDGDSFAYRIAAAVEKTKYMVTTVSDNGKYGSTSQEYATHKEAVAAASESGKIWSRKEVGTLKEAADTLESCIERSIARAQCTVFHLFLGGGGPTFRDHLARIRRYKGNRATKEPPTYLGDLRQYLIRYWGGVVASGEEADDMLSYTAREFSSGPDSIPVIIGYDKDLDQIPGEHYDWVNDKLYTISDAQARLRLWVQVLHGDLGDNIAGCWQVGTSKANRTVRECIEDYGFSDAEMWAFVCSAYEESQEHSGCPYVNLDPVDVALENYNLIRLRQSRHEKHEYRGLFVTGKKNQKETNAGSASSEDNGTSTKGTEQEKPLQVEARIGDHIGLGQEESSV